MRCPSCAGLLQPDPHIQRQMHEKVGVWKIYSGACPACDQTLILLSTGASQTEPPHLEIHESLKELHRQPLPPEVIVPYARDYDEACFILFDSPRASAALSRSCLQLLLREKGEIQPGALSSEVAQVLASKRLPPNLNSILAGVVDVCNLEGNRLKNMQPGLIQESGAGEAEYLLDLLEALFDFYFVAPERIKGSAGAHKEKASAPTANSQARGRSVKRIVTYVSAAGRD